MKKILTYKGVLLAFLMMAFCVATASAKTDCSGAVDEVVDVYKDMAKRVKQCKSINEVASIDYNSLASRLDNLPMECVTAPLTASDKSKIKGGFKIFYDALIDTTSRLTDGLVSAEELDSEMHYMIGVHNQLVDNSDSLLDYATQFGEVEF